jgi:hypothetical protein
MAYAKIIDIISFRSKAKTVNYPISRIINIIPFRAKIKDQLPFRVRFTNIGIPSYGPGNVPPIGIAIIGFNNYIL